MASLDYLLKQLRQNGYYIYDDGVEPAFVYYDRERNVIRLADEDEVAGFIMFEHADIPSVDARCLARYIMLRHQNRLNTISTDSFTTVIRLGNWNESALFFEGRRLSPNIIVNSDRLLLCCGHENKPVWQETFLKCDRFAPYQYDFVETVAESFDYEFDTSYLFAKEVLALHFMCNETTIDSLASKPTKEAKFLFYHDDAKFARFVMNVCRDKSGALNLQKLKSLMTGIGCILERNGSQHKSSALLLTDEPHSEGGTGKGVIMQAISAVRNVFLTEYQGGGLEEYDGYWGRRQSVDIIAIDGLPEDFNASRYAQRVSGDFVVRDTRGNIRAIPFSIAPKFVFTSKSLPSDWLRRAARHKFHVVQLSKYYQHGGKSPYDDFGVSMDTPDEENRVLFYLFLASCLQMYLNHGLIECETVVE